MPDASRELTILLAEDDDGHALLIERNLLRAGLSARILRARSGREVLTMLREPDERTAGRLVILLDIRMPDMDGPEVLRHLKSESSTASIPVYMLTTSDDHREVLRCFELGCNAFITKPVVYESFIEAVRKLANFLQVSAVPVRSGVPK
jgi:CheY-like chemotaxis protein